MDWSILHALNDFLYRHDAVEDPLLFYVNVSEALFVATLAVVFLLAGGVKRVVWRRAAVAATLSAGLALAIAKVVSELVDRQRPFVDSHGVHLFGSHAADPGFPSDHATASFAIATAIFLRHRRWGLVAFAAAAVLSVGRVALGVHFPSDVLAGAALGAAVALLLWQARPLRRRIDALSDRLGGYLDRVLARGAALAGLPWRP